MVDDKTKVDCCESNIIHEDIVKKVRDNMPDEDLLYDISDLFRVFGDSTRVKILHVLFEAEMCVVILPLF